MQYLAVVLRRHNGYTAWRKAIMCVDGSISRDFAYVQSTVQANLLQYVGR